jgi:adenosylhomocysteine nucleosidase
MKSQDILLPISGKKLLFVMAAEAEYGPHLRSRFIPLLTGVGPVESAISLSGFLATLAGQNALPDLVISLGSAGSRTLKQTHIYQAKSVAYRDMDASALGFEIGATPFLNIPKILDLPHLIPGIESATLSTGANIVSGSAYEAIDADMVDMETFALQRCCMVYNVPLIGLRGISDGVSELNHIDDWTEYLDIIDEKLALCVDTVFSAVISGLLDRH